MGVTGPFYYTYVALYWGVQIYEYHITVLKKDLEASIAGVTVIENLD